VKPRKPRIAYFSPLSPDPSGISDYSEELLPQLARHLDLDLFVDGYVPTHPAAEKHRIIDCDRVDPVPLLAGYDAVLYHVGNSASHDYIYDTLMLWPGLVVLHEVSLQHLIAARTIDAGRKDVYMTEMWEQHGREGADRARLTLWGSEAAPWEADPLTYPLNRRVLSQATGVLTHSDFAARHVHEVFPDLMVSRVDHHAFPVPRKARERLRARRAEATSPAKADFTFVSAGNLTPSKQIEKLLRALSVLHRRVPFRCNLIGRGHLKDRTECLIDSFGLSEQVRVVGRVDKDELYCALLDADVSVCLRQPTLGETSGIVMRSLACGTPVLVSDTGWFSELPDEVAYKVPSSGMNSLADALENLMQDRALLRKKAAAGRAYAKERSPRTSALGYAGLIEAAGLFPNRWAGRGFQRITTQMRSLDLEWPGAAAKLRAARYVEMMDWHDQGSSQAVLDRRSRRQARLRAEARAADKPSSARSRIDDDGPDGDMLMDFDTEVDAT
jgi:glycosyltransferase involved in cell wall biosynthesis